MISDFAFQIHREPQAILNRRFTARLIGKKNQAFFISSLPQQRVGWRIIALEQA